MNKTVTVSGVDVEITYRQNMKRIHLRVVPPEGAVKVSAPFNTRDSVINEFIEKNLTWIEAQKNAISSKRIIPECSGAGYIFLLGKRIDIKLIESQDKKIALENGILHIFAPCMPEKSVLKRAVAELKRTQFKAALPQLIRECEFLSGQHAFEWRIKDMQTKWGTCNITAKRIWLRLELVSYPVECIKLVMLHELTHLLEKPHSERFYTILDGLCPNRTELEKQLLSNNYTDLLP